MPTAIQWTDETWNPTTGCTKVSRGCRHCYIDTTIAFRMAGRKFAHGATDLQLHPDRLDKPLHWRKPRRVFVNSLSDLFHEDIPDEYIARVFEVMRCAPTHTFQVLTKRPERALSWFSRCGDNEGMGWITHDATPPGGAYNGTGIIVGDHDRWPLPNVWLGVSIEDSLVTHRADVLRQIPAAVRFISAEPLLGSLYPPPTRQKLLHQWEPILSNTASASLEPVRRAQHCTQCGAYSGLVTLGECPGRRHDLDLTGIDWIIIGGESGPGARPFHLEHAREIVRACIHKPLCALNPYATATDYVDAHRELCDCGSTAVFVKQLGAKPVGASVPNDVLGVFADRRLVEVHDRKGGDMSEWPADLRIREFPRSAVPT